MLRARMPKGPTMMSADTPAAAVTETAGPSANAVAEHAVWLQREFWRTEVTVAKVERTDLTSKVSANGRIDAQRRQIRFREVAIVLRVLLRAHGARLAALRVEEPRLLHHPLPGLPRLLPLLVGGVTAANVEHMLPDTGVYLTKRGDTRRTSRY